MSKIKRKWRWWKHNLVISIVSWLSGILEKEPCEGCGEWAEHWDCEGTPLCQDCWDELMREENAEVENGQ